MALASIDDALAQYNANIPWHGSIATATLALEAVQYLMINRSQRSSDRGSEMSYESLADEKTKLETFLGSTAPRAFGRKRTLRAGFSGREGIQ